MSERLTAEQEAEARAFAESDEPIEMQRGNMLASIIRRDGRQRTARLLVELDAVRAERDDYAERALNEAAAAQHHAAVGAELQARAERAEAGLAALRAGLPALVADAHALGETNQYEPTEVNIEKVITTWQTATGLADTAASAEAYRASVEATLRAEIAEVSAFASAQEAAHQRAHDVTEAERDVLAAALAAVRRLAEPLLDPRQTDGYAKERADLRAALAALPADLATERDRRVRAEALESTADRIAVMMRDSMSPIAVAGLLRARAADERGGR